MVIHVTTPQQFDPLNPEQGSGEDRRHGDRITTIYRPVVIHVGDFAGFCLVRNISAGGLLGMVYADFATEQPITIEFSEDLQVDGNIAWAEDGRIGVAFDSQIDVLKVLQDLGRKMIDDRVNRAPRLSIECPVGIELGDVTKKTAMHNISQRGLKISNLGLSPADEVFVALDGLETRKAVVRWTNDGMAGLNFVRPLEFDKLAGWVIAFQQKRWQEQGRLA
jgi:PilZ domain